jgi:type IV pilus assembly protein PilW
MRNDFGGHTLVELLIAMSIAAILITAIYQIYQMRQKSHVKQQLVVEMQENIRAAVSLIKREIRMAGYDPAKIDGVDSDGDSVVDNDEESAGTGIEKAGRSMIRFTFDNDADMTTGTDERITYGFANLYDADGDGIADSGAAPLGRQTGSGTLIGIAENIQAVGFAYAFDRDNDGILETDDGTADGNVVWAFDADPSDANDELTTNLDNQLLAAPVPLSAIRAVRVWLLARTSAPIRGYFENRTYSVGGRNIACSDNYPRRLLSATVYCRNMGL